MALTPTEEAQLRLLIAQEPAILSLAANEPTITSKLASTKVTLSDLAAAGAASNSDLLLTRQGVTDKSITALTLYNYMQGKTDPRYVLKAGDTVTGALALSAGGTTTTPAQYNNSTSIATTAFVQKALGNVSGYIGITATSGSFTAAQGGLLIGYGGAAAATYSLPNPPSLSLGTSYWLNNFSAFPLTLTTPSGNFNPSNNNTATYVLPASTSIIVVADGPDYVVFGGTGFSNLGGNGCQKLASGLILQWGSVLNSTGGGTTVTFPLQFPGAVFTVNNTAISSSGSFSAQVDGSPGLSSFVSSIFGSSNTRAAAFSSWWAVGR